MFFICGGVIDATLFLFFLFRNRKYPDNPKFLSTLGKLQSQVTGSMGNAIEILEKATNLADAEEDAFLALSSIMGQKSQYNETLFRLKRAMDMYPNSPLVWNNVGSCYLGQGKYHKVLWKRRD